MPACIVVAVMIAVSVIRSGGARAYLVGGWSPPLGLALRADGLSAVMMVTVAIVMGATALFARADFHQPRGLPESRRPFMFWTLFLAVWGALNAILLGSDLFNLYVALELLTFAAVPMVCLDGRAETVAAALRYLLFALLGSMLYLLGAALIYGAYGTLDIVQLSSRVGPEPAAIAAAVLMTTGLLAKTALFPLYLWLPPAHAGAPAAASAVLSALVVKGSFFLTVRLWFDAMPGLVSSAAAQILATLGAGAILVGSVLALRQQRLKLMVAYSTVAQIGYLFLMYPLAFGPESMQPQSGGALTGGMLQAMSHATAKAAMFMSAGLIYAALGHDRTTELGGIGRMLPMSVAAFALGGLALIGVPTSGAYLAKDLLLQATATTGQWWWAVVIQAGGVFTSSYVLLVLAHALAPADAPIRLHAPVSRVGEAAALALASCSLLLGLVPWGAILAVPRDTPSDSFTLGSLVKILWPILAGAVLAILLGSWGPRLARMPVGKTLVSMIYPVRLMALGLGKMLERVDRKLRQWPAAGLSLLALVMLFGAAMLAAR
jgi:formate hydrogenlyase subunit 3/multisubunit Na+/H+ antiporter MnhD subunit